MASDVLITGIGAITPLGSTLDETWQAALEGESGADDITRFDPEKYRLRSRIACEVDANVDAFDRVDPRSMGRFTKLGLIAAEEAVDDAGLSPGSDGWPSDRIGVSFATGMSGAPEYEQATADVEANRRVSSRFLITFLPNLLAGHVSIEFDARGPNRAPATACAAGAHAIADAVEDIRAGRADLMIAGGGESAVTPTAMVGFDSMRALSRRTESPASASRPFDVDRDGFVMAEGGGALLLEAREHAESRGATAYAELAGVGMAGDASHPTRPPADAHGLKRAMRAAIGDAGLTPAAIDCVNAHATSTGRGDVHEANAIAAVTADPLVWAPKGGLGHTLGAAGAIETALGAKGLAGGRVPPTCNLDTLDEECNVTVATEPTGLALDGMLCNAAGFGGTNVCLALTDA
jgi:3-oxoacyl-[acyl-carrier-protein] synthase II